MGLYRIDVYRCPSIGVFLRANDSFVLAPKGLTSTKTNKLSSLLGVKPIKVSISGLRLIGPLVAMNNKGILVSRLAEDDEIEEIRNETGLPVERIFTKYTSIGNLVVANDHGAIVSSTFSSDDVKKISDVLGVQSHPANIASYYQVGSIVAATNTGVVVHPNTSEEEITIIHDMLKVNVEPATINCGIPFVSSGIVANSRNAIVGTLTSGPELLILSRILKV